MDCEDFDGTDSEKFVIFTQDDLHAERFPLMMEIHRQGKWCDVTLKVEDQSFSAHRIILAATIPYFYVIFTNDMVESRMKEITMKEIDPMAMELLINFAYSGSVRIDNENVLPLMIGAAYLQMNRVRDACAEFLVTRVDMHNVLAIRRIAGSLGCTQLVSEVEKYIQGNFSNIAQSDEFLNWTFDELTDIIRRDELNVQTEENIFEACMRWIKWDGSRTVHLPQVLSKVRLPLLTPQFLADRVATEDLIRTSVQCRDLLNEARDIHLMSERPGFVQSFRTQHRCYEYGHIFVVGFLTKSGEKTKSMIIYDPMTKEWRTGEAMSMIQAHVGVTVTDSKLFAFGAFNRRGEILSALEVYDPKTKVWYQAKQATLCKRFGATVTALDDRVYICGGKTGERRYSGMLSSVECYHPKTNSWTTVAPMMENRTDGGAAALNKYVYALGGRNGRSLLNSVERYDPKENSWTKITPMTSRRWGPGVATLNGKLYACGGHDGSSVLNSVEEYDPTKDEWRLIAPMNVQRVGTSLCTNMGKLWAIGGHDGKSGLSTVEVWDPKEDTWSFAPAMGAHGRWLGVGVIPI